jgi:hypothetical protein
VSKREILRRLEAVEAQLSQRPTPPLEGQEAIDVAHIRHHTYEGPGACRAEFFGETCGQHRDAHQLVEETDLEETR